MYIYPPTYLHITNQAALVDLGRGSELCLFSSLSYPYIISKSLSGKFGAPQSRVRTVLGSWNLNPASDFLY